MHVSLAFVLLLTAYADAGPLHSKHFNFHSRRAVETPISVQSSEYLCVVTSKNTDTVRDLGYVGKIGDNVIHTYGDTLNAPGSSFWMTSDSSALGTDDPCQIYDAALSDGDHPAQFVPTMAEYGETNTADAMGITNVIATSTTTGMLFFLKNHRPIGGDDYIVGAGVADVMMSAGKPTATRTAEFWWDSQKGEPNYGDVTAYGNDDFIWGLGHGGGGEYSYLTRVPKESYHDLSTWEYFDGSVGRWTSDRLYNPTSAQALQWNEAEGAVWGVGQGQMIWSTHYNKILFVYALNWKDAKGQTAIMARTADRPRGPWSAATTLFSVSPDQADGLVYSPIANPHFDASGKTLIVTITNSPNTIQAHKVTFN